MDVRLTVENVHALSAGTATLGTLKLTDFHIIFSAPVPAPAPIPPPAPPPKTTKTTTATVAAAAAASGLSPDAPLDASSSSSHGSSNGSSRHSSHKQRPPAPVAVRQRESWITYPIISHCTYRPTPAASGIPSTIRLRCRDFNFVCFNFADDRQAREVFELIRSRTCRLGSIEKLYAFFYVPARQERDLCGWDLYDARAEFRRQGISEKLPDRGWRLSTINKDYAFSPTYPSVLVVPSKISDNVLKYAGQFRSRARIPALTYYHPITQCSITRSSQPLVGVRNNRSIQDERLVSACFYKSTAVFGGSGGSDGGAATRTSSSSGSSTPRDASQSRRGDTVLVAEDGTVAAEAVTGTATGDDAAMDADDGAADDKPGSRVVGARRDNLIVDARPAINSLAMQVVGKGSENMEHYKSATKMFLSIDNIHVMRDSLNKVIEAVKDADVSPFPPNQDLLAKSGWLKHIRGILTGSQTIARQVGVSAAHVLIHCSDGWDRTSQLSALAQIMLDPYFRTIDGFIVLVEKDWLSFGHMFQQRSGYLGSEKWFVTQYDGMAGTKIDPGDSDAAGGGGGGGGGSSGGPRNEVFDHAVASARRFFKKSLSSQEKDESDADLGGDGAAAGGGGGGDEGGSSVPTTAAAPVEESQATRPREISPVFHQFLDATYQLLRQHPTRFEFSERFLRRLLYHLYACQYGTFLYNNERQRRDARVRERTSSVWDYFLSRRAEFLNPQYDAAIDSTDRQDERLLFPRLNEIRWWHQVFNRSDEDMNGALNAAAAAAAAAAERSASYHAAAAATMTATAAAPATIVVAPAADDDGGGGGGGDDGLAGAGAAARGGVWGSPSPRRGASPVPPPSLHASQSAGAELEKTPPPPPPPRPPSFPSAADARSMLATPVGSGPGSGASSSSLNRSSSASDAGAFAALRDGFAGLGLGQKMGGVLGSFGGVGSGSGSGGGSGGGGGSSSSSGSGKGSSTAPRSNVNGREALFGIVDSDGAAAADEPSVFDTVLGRASSGSGGRRSNRTSREEEELREMS